MYEARSHAQPVMQASWRVSRRRGSWPAALERGGAPQDGFAAVARLAWSLLLGAVWSSHNAW